MTQKIAQMKPMKVLVVDDEPHVCRSVEKILKRQGHVVEHALCVSGALDLFDNGDRFDLIIADLMMPQAGGLDLLKVMRERKLDIPVLIITGYASIQSAVEATRLGAAGYLPKPFTPEELENSLEGVVVRGPWQKTEPVAQPPTDLIDVDMPFSARELASVTSASYVEHLTRSDIPVVPQRPKVAEGFCELGKRQCKRYRSKGVCKQEVCPIVAAENKKKGGAVVLVSHVFDPIDVDMPFSASEVASFTSEDYAAALGRSDMPVVGRWRSAATSAGAPRILAVDDEAVVVNSIRKSLACKGYVVDEAFTCKDAMARILEREYALVLLDMRMSDGNGLEIIPMIKKHRPNLPVVIVTGYASVDTAVEAIRHGASDYMAKPFTPEELYTTTSRALRAAVA